MWMILQGGDVSKEAWGGGSLIERNRKISIYILKELSKRSGATFTHVQLLQHDGIFGLIYEGTIGQPRSGGYKEMSSILADQ